MRLFAAITVPEVVRDHLARALALVQPSLRHPRNPWIPSMNWHITLAFYGEQSDGVADEVARLLRTVGGQTPRFDLELVGAGVFRHDVCWIGVGDPASALGPLAQRVRGEYAVEDQHVRNRFHVTVSRMGRRAGLEPVMAALSVYRGPVWTVDRLSLLRSDIGEGVGGHPLYTPLATVSLEP